MAQPSPEKAAPPVANVQIFRPLARQIARVFSVPIFQVEEALHEEPTNALALAAFCAAEGPSKLLVYSTPAAEDDEDAEGPQIYVSSGESDRFVERGALLVKLREGAPLDTAAAVDTEVTCSVVLGSPVKSLLATLEHVFQPALTAAVGSWASALPDDDNGERGADFFGGLGKFVGLLSDAVNGVEGGIELVKPSVRADLIELKPPALARAAASPETLASFEAAVNAWCVTVDDLCSTSPPRAALVPEGDEGPMAELEYWKTRANRFSSLADQLRTRESKVVLGVLGSTRSAALRTWKALENIITDQTNEAKDNVKYLCTLEKYFDTLGGGTPTEICDALPSVLNCIKMMAQARLNPHPHPRPHPHPHPRPHPHPHSHPHPHPHPHPPSSTASR
jgi:hypothetical protein